MNVSVAGLLTARKDELAQLAGADESFEAFCASEAGAAAIAELLEQHKAALRQGAP